MEFTSTSFTLPDGRSLDLYVEGPDDGTPLVFHHGTPSAGIPYGAFVDAAAERGLRWVSYSRPGYGESARREGRSVADCVADVEAIVDHLGARAFFTAGASGGGPHTLACAALLPDRVLGCAAIASVAPYEAEGLDWMAGQGPENVAEWQAQLAGPEPLRAFLEEEAGHMLAASSPDAFIASMAGLLPPVDRSALTGAFAKAMINNSHRALERGIWGWYDDDVAFLHPWGFDLDSMRAPVALWQGGEDLMVPFAHGEWLATHVAKARPHLHPEQGHLSIAAGSFPQVLDELIEHRSKGIGVPT
jgi:pimeloyl-ACP methyl ester carboxylesterase